MKKLCQFALGATFALSLIAMPSGAADAQSLAKTYQGKTLTIVVGYGAGGTYGKNSRLLAKHLKGNIPGKPTIIVQHMTGAGGMKATNYAYNAMPKNGLWLLMPPEMMVVSELLRPKKVKYKSNRFTWLGRVIGSNTTLAVRRDSGVRTIDDLRKKVVTVGSSGVGSPTFLVPQVINGILGTKIKIVKGYRGSAKMQLAMEQGETQGLAVVWTSWFANRPQWFEGPNSFAVALIQNGFQREKGIPNVPLIYDLAKTEDDKQITRFMSTAGLIGRGLAFPPGVPKHLIGPMREIFWKTVNTPALKADAKKRRLPLNQKTGADIQKTVNDIMKMSPAVIEKARKMTFG